MKGLEEILGDVSVGAHLESRIKDDLTFGLHHQHSYNKHIGTSVCTKILVGSCCFFFSLMTD